MTALYILAGIIGAPIVTALGVLFAASCIRAVQVLWIAIGGGR